MQKLLNFTNDLGSFYLYQYDQDSNELLEKVSLSPNDQSKLARFNSNKRKKEWLAVRHLLKVIHPEQQFQLVYNEHGKPSLHDGTKISISHSDNFVGIALSNKHEIGIDIQYFKSKIDRIQSKFIHPKEAALLKSMPDQDRLTYLHGYWTAKEAIYKTIAMPGTVFSEIDCSDLKIEKKENWMATYRGEIFTLYTLRIGQLFLSYSHFASK